MPDGGETEFIPSTGDYVDAKTGKSTGENVLGKPPRDKQKTAERQIPHTDTSVVPDNAPAKLIVEPTAEQEKNRFARKRGETNEQWA
jgi:hypothetical protein